VSDYFEMNVPSPYMLLVAPVRASRRIPFERGVGDDMLEIVRRKRSDIPAVTHIDGSARVQTISREDHPGYYDAIAAFEKRTKYAVVVNTSFNVRGEPIVNTPDDAYRCFMRTEMDALVLGNFLVVKDGSAKATEKGAMDESEKQHVAEKGPLDERLRRVFREEILPLARNASARDVHVGLRASGARSTWRPVSAELLNDIAPIPHEIDEAKPRADEFAAAVTRYWQPGPVTDAMQGTLARLVAFVSGAERQTALDEDVSSFTYVMF
jgi:carbamoyltransferase